MKKAFASLYFFIGGSIVAFILSLLGCNTKDYKFIYKMGRAACFKQDTYSGMVEITDSATFDSLFVIEHFETEILTSSRLHLFQNNLYAFQPGDPSYKPVEKLTEIKIITANDYNAQYPAGSDITPICRFTVNDALADPGSSNDSSKKWALTLLNSSESYFTQERNLGFTLTEAPATSGFKRFVFEIRTEVNELLRDTSKAIIIYP